MKADKKMVERLVKTARGQLEGVLRMIEEDRYCMDIAGQLAASEAIVHRAAREVIKAHLDSCVLEAFASGDSEQREQKLNEIMALIDKCSK